MSWRGNSFASNLPSRKLFQPPRAFLSRRPETPRCLAAPTLETKRQQRPSELGQATQKCRQRAWHSDGQQQGEPLLGPEGKPRGVKKAPRLKPQVQQSVTQKISPSGGAKSGSGETKRQAKRADARPPQRLSKVVSQAGLASRRGAEDLIMEGLVKVNGQIQTVPQHMVTSTDEIKVRGKPIPKSTPKYYFVLNKPKGYLCANPSASDVLERTRLVVDLFQPWLQREWKVQHQHPNAVPPRLFTVGRLDVQTTGLIFVTNDGEWAQQVQHPSRGLTKEYVVTLSSVPSSNQLDAIAAGCVVDGAFVQPVSVSLATLDTRRRDKLRVVVGEGRNREVRVLMENAGLEVSSLKRVRVGGFRLPKDLSIGEFRLLKNHEVRQVGDKGFQQNPQPSNRKQPVLLA